MKIAIRSILWPLAAFTLLALILPDTLYAPPRLSPPSRAKKPSVPAPTAAGPGFQVGPDAVTLYQVDSESDRNEVVFTSKAPKETIKGKTTKASGQLELNPRKLETVGGSFSVHWKDLDTGNPTRNGHMMAVPWVDAKSHPKIVFTVSGFEISKSAAKTDKTGKTLKGKLVGSMAMNGKEKEMKIPVTLAYVEAGEGKNGEKVKEGIGIKASFSVLLEDFDIKGKGVGQAVAKKEMIKVSLVLAKSDGTEKKDEGGTVDKKKDTKKESDES